MSDPNTLRILSLDGGGERGYMSLTFLQRFMTLTTIDITTFDVITGTSIGGIMALSLAFGLTPTAMLPFFTDQGPYIFTLGSNPPIPPFPPYTPSIRPSGAYKAILLTTNTPFYQSLNASYGAGLLAATIQTQFGINTLQNLQTNVLIPAYQQYTDPDSGDITGTYVLFSNIYKPSFIGQNELISNVALATSAAPAYLPPWVIDLSSNYSYIDGGVYMNNPASLGRSLAQMLKPTANRTCILSIGTGIGEMGFDPSGDTPRAVRDIIDTATIELLFKLFDISSTGGQESVAKALALESQDSLSQLYYYRFQPMLDPTLNTELDNTDPTILDYYQTTANNWVDGDMISILNFIGHLEA